MLKTRSISMIAASLLTATVVLTGCGGGGSSSANNVASASSSSQTSAPSLKKVKVSDGYVLAATVKCKTIDGVDVVQFNITENPGEYEADVTGLECPVLCAKDGYIDANGNGHVDIGEAKAPRMTAPGAYSNINPFTTLIQNGATPAEVAAAFELPADTNFDVAIPEASDAIRKKAVILSVILSYIETQQTSTRALLPGIEEEVASSSSSTSNSQSSTPLTLNQLVSFVKSGNVQEIENLLPQEIITFINQVENSPSGQYDLLAQSVLAQYNGAAGSTHTASSSDNSSSSSSTATGGGILPTAGAISSSMGGATSSSSSMNDTNSGGEISYSSQPISSSSSSSAGDVPPPPPPSDNTSSSSSSSSSAGDVPPPPPPPAGV